MYIMLFLICLISIIYISTNLAKYADLYSKKSKILSSTLTGSLIISSITSLPEFFSSITSSSIHNVDMALSNLFGSNITNIFFIALLDIFMRKNLLKTYPLFGWNKEKILNALFLFSNTSYLLFFLSIFQYEKNLSPILFFIPIFFNFFAYLYSLKTIFHFSHAEKELESNETLNHSNKSLSLYQIQIRLGILAIALLIVSIILTTSGDKISQMKLFNITIGGTFIGFIFIAFATSLPELISSYQAISLGNSKMALGAIYGSNLFNILIYSFSEISFIISQIYYKKYPIQNILSKTQPIMLIIGIISLIMLSISIISSITNPSKKNHYQINISSIFIFIMYLFSLFLIFKYRS